MRDARDEQIEVLKLVLTDVEKERDRLRSARASFTARLGPLPASAALVTGIVAAAAGKVAVSFTVAAGGVFIVIVVVSIFFARLKPYRVIRADKQGADAVPFRGDETNVVEWLRGKIELEKDIYGSLRDPKRAWLPRRHVKTLSEGLMAERAASNLVQALTVAIAAILIVGISAH